MAAASASTAPRSVPSALISMKMWLGPVPLLGIAVRLMKCTKPASSSGPPTACPAGLPSASKARSTAAVRSRANLIATVTRACVMAVSPLSRAEALAPYSTSSMT